MVEIPLYEFETLFPDEVLLLVLSGLSGPDLFRSASVNRRWNRLVHLFDEVTLFRRFPKTYGGRPHLRRDLHKVENEAYRYLSQSEIIFFNAAKDGDDKALVSSIEGGAIDFDGLFCIDQSELTSPFEIIVSRASQEVRNRVYSDLLIPRCDGTLELLLWAIRSHQALDKVRELWETEYREQQNSSVRSVLRALFTRQSLDEIRREEHRKNRSAENGRTPLLEACMYGYLDAVKFLMRRGENISKTDQDGWTPLLEACRWGYLEIVSCLIENGAHTDVNKPNNFGLSPLSESVKWEEREIMIFLVKNGADVTLLNSEMQGKFLYLLGKDGNPIESSLIEKMLETYLKRRDVRGKFAARCLLKALRAHKQEDLNQVRNYHVILSEPRLKLIYQLSKPFLDEIARASEEPSSRSVLWMSRK